MSKDIAADRLARARGRARGLATCESNAQTVADTMGDELDLAWGVRFKLPFSYVASKNSIYGRMSGTKRRIFIKAEARKYRDAIGFLTKQAVKNIEIKHDKLWIDIFVEKPHHRGDAINVLDLVCDGIKSAIPLDDRWYAIKRLDWSVNKSDPHLFIGLAQEVGAADSKICSYCGRIRPLTDFTFDRNAVQGRGHFCIECRAPSYPKGPNKKNR